MCIAFEKGFPMGNKYNYLYLNRILVDTVSIHNFIFLPVQCITVSVRAINQKSRKEQLLLIMRKKQRY